MFVSERQTGCSRLVHPKWLLAGFWICVFIAIAAVVRRLVALANPGRPGNSPTASLDATFASHTVMTIAHIIPAAVFVILSIIVLLRAKQHRWVDRSFFLFGAITGLTAYAMSAYAVGGRIECAAVFVFDTPSYYRVDARLLGFRSRLGSHTHNPHILSIIIQSLTRKTSVERTAVKTVYWSKEKFLAPADRFLFSGVVLRSAYYLADCVGRVSRRWRPDSPSGRDCSDSANPPFRAASPSRLSIGPRRNY